MIKWLLSQRGGAKRAPNHPTPPAGGQDPLAIKDLWEMDTSQEVGVGRPQRKRPPAERSLWETRRGSGPEGARFGDEGRARCGGWGGTQFGGPARREPGSGAGVEPGSGVRRGGSPVLGRGRSPVRGRGAPRDPRGPGASRRLLACPALTHPAALPRRASRARQSAAERSSIPGSPRGLSLDRPGLEPPEGTASPGAHHLGGLRGGGCCRLGRPPSRVRPKRLCLPPASRRILPRGPDEGHYHVTQGKAAQERSPEAYAFPPFFLYGMTQSPSVGGRGQEGVSSIHQSQ